MTAELTARRGARGFTLVELMVALTGGLFVSVMVFTLAKDSSRFYMREARVADATLSAVSGFERLRTDLMRISFMASPNIRRDVQNGRLCGNTTGWPQELQRLAGLRIQPDTPAPNAALTANGLAPDAIQIAGNFRNSDVFAMSGVVAVAGGGFRVNLQTRIGALNRRGYRNPGTDQQALLDSLFPAGAALRIVDDAGMIQYGRVAQTIAVGGPAVILSAVPALSMRGATATNCGLTAESQGYVNVVNFVRYQVRPLASAGAIAAYGPLATSGATPWEANRTELVREEVDVTGAALANTEEIVAEYAVDLSFGLTVAQTITNGVPTQLASIAAGNPAIVNWAGDVTTTAGLANQGPHRVRALRVRLAIRSREPDRDLNIVTGGPVAPGLYRFSLAANGASLFARVRSLQAEVALHNQAMAQ